VPNNGQGMSDATTRGVRVRVSSLYIPERSSPPENEYFFAYRVRISNEGQETVQLVSRHWVITDSVGRVEEVKGPGVVGEQPVLGPGESFEYTSYCPLKTPIGSMHGTYQMVTANGQRFDAEIAPFSLAVPTALN
jgi:ApaG protein